MQTKLIEVTALVLDFDGVVLESTEIKTEAFVEMFRDYPEHLDAIVAHHEKHLGMSRYKKFQWIYEHLFKKPLSEKSSKELGERYSDLVFEKILQTPFVPGALETLVTFRSLRIPVFVISGTPHDELHRIIAERNIQRFFSQVWGSPHEKTTTLRKIRTSHHLRKSEMIFVGDGLFDYEAAVAEDVPFIARLSGAEKVDWDRRAVPNIPDLTPLAKIDCDNPIRIRSREENVPELILTLKPDPHRVHRG